MDVSCWDMTQTPAIPDDILAALDTLPNSARPVLVRLRGVIFDVASTVPGAGDVSLHLEVFPKDFLLFVENCQTYIMYIVSLISKTS